MTLTDQFNAFCKASKGKLGAAERGLYITLLDIWNRLRRPEWFDVSNTELQSILATGSHNSITRWRKILEREGFIEAKVMGRGKPLRFHISELATTSENDVPTSESDVPKKTTTSENDVLPRQKVTSGRSENDVGVRQKMTTSQSTEIYTEVTEGEKIQSNNEVINPPEISPPPLPENILIAYQSKIAPTPSDKEQEILAVLCADRGCEAVLYGIDRAYEKDIRTIKYIRGVVNNLREGEEYGQRHRATRAKNKAQFDPEWESRKWENETEGWD